MPLGHISKKGILALRKMAAYHMVIIYIYIYIYICFFEKKLTESCDFCEYHMLIGKQFVVKLNNNSMSS